MVDIDWHGSQDVQQAARLSGLPMHSPEDWLERLAQVGYIADPDLSAALWLLEHLGRPLLLEGDAGVGKTEVAKALAEIHDCRLIRLQCYEGLDVNSAVYEWNYQRQLLVIKLLETSHADDKPLDATEQHIFSEAFLLKRPLLEAISQAESPVLLIDEVDRADEEFEAYLLEVLSDFQISIPELGTQHAISRPRVLLTSNGTRELSDALRRRCLYHYLDYPSFDKELRIVQKRLPGIELKLARQLVAFTQQLREQELRKIPGIAETLDWGGALMGMGIKQLNSDPGLLQRTLSCLLKTKEDCDAIPPEVTAQLVARAL